MTRTAVTYVDGETESFISKKGFEFGDAFISISIEDNGKQKEIYIQNRSIKKIEEETI